MLFRANLTGQIFGHLTVVRFDKPLPSGHTALWRCRCSCGKEVSIRANNLVSGNSESCGCQHGLPVDYPIKHSQLLALVKYQPRTGKFIRTMPGRHCATGDVLGSLDKSNGYVRVTIEGKKYWAHRLAWFYTLGAWPEKQIDHKDTNRANNKWSNLRIATQTQNNGNCVLPKTNTSGFKGVSFDTRRKCFVAQIGHQGKNHYLGRFIKAEDAALKYDKAANSFFGEYARTNFGEQ